MRSRSSSRIFALALLTLVLPLAWTACKTLPPEPAAVLPVAWPVLLPPPATGIDLAASGSATTRDGRQIDAAGKVLVPLDYWTDLVAYILEVDRVRASLDRQGLLAK